MNFYYDDMICKNQMMKFELGYETINNNAFFKKR